MATFDKINLGISEPENFCGAGFVLNKEASIDFIFSDEPNYKIILKKGSKVIIIQFKIRITNWNELLDNAYSQAQKCLDILAISKRYFHSLPIAQNDNLLWTRENTETTIRL
jgi:hypothetical protein